MPPRKFVDYQEIHHRVLAAQQAALLCDTILDIIKLSLGIDLAVGCRSRLDRSCEDFVKDLAKSRPLRDEEDRVEWAIKHISAR
jgi:hypothetical protein